MTPIADMVQSMLAAGIAADMIVLAVRTAEVVARSAGGPAVAVAQHITPAAAATVGRTDTSAARRARNAARMRTARAQRALAQAVVSAEPAAASSMESTAAHAAHAPAAPSFFLSSLSDSLEERKKDRVPSSARVRAQLHALPHDWRVKPSHFELGLTVNISEIEVSNLGEQLRDWAASKAELKADWDAYFKSWIRKNARDSAQRSLTLVRQVSREKYEEGQNCDVFVKMETPQWAAWQQHSLETRGKGTPRNERFGWYFPSEWPPGRERKAS